jgi:predicted NBD/HSP70 family sugar kinase
MRYGGIEAGGTKWVCGVGDHPGPPEVTETFPTTGPAQTVSRAARFFAEHGPIEALGVGSFGPVDIRPNSPTWGTITTTPKPGWGDTDVVGALHAEVKVPIALDTDVNAAALGEWRWGAAAGLDTFCYITVGTGIGGGAVANGRMLHGLLHPEFGHMRIPHDRTRDPFDGICPYHGDCLEGLASGESIRQRWGQPGPQISGSTAWEIEAEYLALALVNVVCLLSPQRIIVGGGVTKQPTLLPLARQRLRELLAGYLRAPELTEPEAMDGYVVAPRLGSESGVIGAIELARDAERTAIVG